MFPLRTNYSERNMPQNGLNATIPTIFIFHRYGKNKFSNQKFQCLSCRHQFASDKIYKIKTSKYPPDSICGKNPFLHHDYHDYSNLIGKAELKRLRHSVHIIIYDLYQIFYG